jgi:Cysteine-rich secretory protein family
MLPHQIERSDKDDLDYYRKLNEREQRLIEYKDNDIALNLKIDQLYIINKSRRKNNAPPLKLDIHACRVANKMCREAAENGYLGHWNLAGEEPYLRYAFAGGYDHVSENAYGEWSSNNYGTSASLISSMMKSGHEKFMAERAPNNGHKKNIIDKSHNFVGIGFFIAGKQFRYYEEFIDRYFEFENIPSEARVAEPCKITVRTRGQYFLYNLIIYRENWPRPLTPEQIIKRGSYRDFTDEIYKNLTAWDLSKYRNGNIYEIPVSFSKEGIFYIQIYSDEREIIKPAPLSTKGKTPESGIVIKVYR